MKPYILQFKFVNFYKLYFPLAYDPDIGTEPSIYEHDSHLYINIFYTFPPLTIQYG